MKTIYLLKGLPASGKSTWAKERIAKDPNTKRVNKDDLRAMLDNSRWSKANEKFVLKLRDHIIVEALNDGKHIIVDDTNLHPKHEINLKRIAKEHNAKVEVVFFDTPVEVCLERDAKRENPVGDEVIISMYDRYINNDLSHIPLEKIWIITDTHFDHQMFIDEGIRPADYNEQIIKNWNELVGKEDLVIHLGDVIFGHNKDQLGEIMKGLNGNKVLVKGNHDYKPDQWYLKNGFEHVYQDLHWKDIYFTHIPAQLPEGKRLNIHGHLHNSNHRVAEVRHVLTDKHVLVALELTDYKPLKLEELIK